MNETELSELIEITDTTEKLSSVIRLNNISII